MSEEEIDIDKLIENYEKDLELADKYGCFITKTKLADELLRVCKNLKKKIDKLQKENEALGRTLDDEIADNDRLQENNLSYQEELAKAWKEIEELKVGITGIEISRDTLVEDIKELKQENRKLEEQRNKLFKKDFEFLAENYIHKNIIKEAIGDKDIPDEMILTYIETLVSENNRLEDIEDRKIQIEYNNVFNKGVKSVEQKNKS